MSSHTIIVSTVGRISGFAVLCTCSSVLLEENAASLDELAGIAHDHIEASESMSRYGGQPTDSGEYPL